MRQALEIAGFRQSPGEEAGADVLFDAQRELEALQRRAGELQERLRSMRVASNRLGDDVSDITRVSDHLDEICFATTEMVERMRRPYVVSPTLQAIREVLDALAESGQCNSIILEGEPGTGKTQWAYAEAAREIQEGRDIALIHIRVKAGMTAQDLLYTVDTIERLNDAQMPAPLPGGIQQEAALWRDKILNREINPRKDLGYQDFIARMSAVQELDQAKKNIDLRQYVRLGPLGEAIRQSALGKKVWLLIDEIEKGDEELMTGLLDEIENLVFTITQTGETIHGEKKNLRIVITTNTEDSNKIPPSFRRRSLYHFVEYPTREEMAKIIDVYFPHLQIELLQYALDVFYACQHHPHIEKKPSPPELLAWIGVLLREYQGTLPKGIPHKEILLKYRPDHAISIAVDKMKKINQEREESLAHETRISHILRKIAEGKQVYRLWDELLNNPLAQEDLAPLYAELDSLGLYFTTPTFIDEMTPYGYKSGQQVAEETFKLFVPGAEDLGDGYYALTEDLARVFEPIIRGKLYKNTIPDFEDLGISREDLRFVHVSERTAEYTRGSLSIGSRSSIIPDVYRLGRDIYIFEEHRDVHGKFKHFLEAPQEDEALKLDDRSFDDDEEDDG